MSMLLQQVQHTMYVYTTRESSLYTESCSLGYDSDTGMHSSAGVDVCVVLRSGLSLQGK